MKALFLSNDPTLFDPMSPARARMREYASYMDQLHVLSHARLGAKTEIEGNLHLHPLMGGRIAAFLAMEGAAKSLILKEGIDVVSAQDPFEHGWAAMKAVRGTKAKLQIQIHTDFLSPWFVNGKGFRAVRVRMPVLNKVRRMLADKVLPQADGIRVVSERVKASLSARYGEKIVAPVVLPLRIQLVDAASVPLPDHAFSFALMTVSRLEPEKRVEDILMAIGRIAQSYPSVGLFVVGDGRERAKLEELTRKLGLANRVVFLGWRTNVAGLLKSANAYIQASAYEGYGAALLEAALARLPIITTDVGIVGEVFKGYEDVLAVPVADPAALAVQISVLVEDHQQRTMLAMGAEHSARNHLATLMDQPEMIANELAKLL